MTWSERLFDAFMAPLELSGFRDRRAALIPHAHGHVLEVGAGTGSNLAHYEPQSVESLTLTDLEPGALVAQRLRRAHARWAGQVATRLQHADLMSLPFSSASFDTVVVTLVLCSVPDQRQAVAEIRRVLKPDGRLVFLEHIRPQGRFGHVVDRVNPAWHACNGECRINRRTVETIADAGFDVSATYSGAGLVAGGLATPSPSRTTALQ